jgi:hypothetical protein
MTPAFLKMTGRLARWREWEPNPVLLKELRQAVRSHVLSGVLILLLVLLFVGGVVTLAVQGEAAATARNMFDAFLAVLAAGSLVIIPLYTGIRVAIEQHQSDLILYTPLPVTKLVQGKFLGGAYLAGLFYSVCMPFMTFCLLLRGLDWLTIQFVLLVLFATTCVAIIAAIAAAVSPFPVLPKLFLGVAFAGGLMFVCWRLVIFFFHVVRLGAGPLLARSGFFTSFLAVCGMAMIGAMFFYSQSISHIIKDCRPDDQLDYKPKFEQSNG